MTAAIARPEGGRGRDALWRLAQYADVRLVLDVGSGVGIHADYLQSAGKRVITNSLVEPADLVGDYLALEFSERFDAIWACHVLEHQPNVGAFLAKCFDDLRDGGVLAITVPPFKHEIVGGHLTLWNSGLLLYNLILAGFDCRDARVSDCYPSSVGEMPYNISVIVRKVAADLPGLEYDEGDIQKLSRFFPFEAEQGFDGRLPAINW